MNYTHLLNEFKKASLFDLYRMQVAISNELDNPDRLVTFKQYLRIGMEITYFDSVQNRLMSARLMELRRKTALILDLEQKVTLVIPYYMINIENLETTIYENTDDLTANNLAVGDCVGFNKDGEDIVGVIKRLNHKTVTLTTNIGQEWRVAYALLYRVHDAEVAREKLIK